MKRIIALVSALFVFSILPCTASALSLDLAPYQVAENKPTSLRATFVDLERTLTFNDGVALRVKYTRNDTYGTVAGIKSIRDVSKSAQVSNVTWTHKQGHTNKYYTITVTYYVESKGWKSDLRYLYA